MTLDLQINPSVKEVDENTIKTEFKGVKNLLKCQVIYGINGAGKSNIISALDFLRDFILRSHRMTVGDMIETEPFLLVEDTSAKPSFFSIEFIHEENRYLFEIGVTDTRVHFERLIAYPDGGKQTWYKRVYDPTKNDYVWSFGSQLKGEKEVTRKRTLENTLFFSKAAQDNHEQIKPLLEYFSHNLRLLYGSGNLNETKRLLNSPEEKEKVLALFRGADFGIEDIYVARDEVDEIPDFFPEELSNFLKSEPMFGLKPKSIHRIPNSEKYVTFDFMTQESYGARKLLGYAGDLIRIRENGGTIVIDEIENNLHLKLVDYIIGLFQPGDDRLPAAQIIFTTHNPIILETNNFRRDQVLFAAKNKESKSTQLYNLSQSHKFSQKFKQVRKGSNLLLGYLEDGKYYLPPKINEQFVFDFLNKKSS